MLGLVHRIGRLDVGEASVVIVAAAAHHGEAFATCRYAIELIKQVAPVWKHESFEDGHAWVEGATAGGITTWTNGQASLVLQRLALPIDLATIAAGKGGFVIHGQDANDSSGFSVASAGDVNGDGFDDLIIGAPFADAAGNAKGFAGDSYVVFGRAAGWGAAVDLATIAAGLLARDRSHRPAALALQSPTGRGRHFPGRRGRCGCARLRLVAR